MSESILFKFRAIDKYLIDCLKNESIYFAHPTRLNDPFDCRVNIQKAAENAISHMAGAKKENLSKLISSLKSLVKKIQNDTGNVGICSFSLDLENTLLWSHYADDHRGLCLMYEIPNEFFNDPKNQIIGVPPVEYGTNPLTDWFVLNTPENSNIDLFEFTVEVIKSLREKLRYWRKLKPFMTGPLKTPIGTRILGGVALATCTGY